MGIRVREEAPYSYRDFNKHERKYVIKIEKKRNKNTRRPRDTVDTVERSCRLERRLSSTGYRS